MKSLLLYLFCAGMILPVQGQPYVTKIDSVSLQVDNFYGIDNFGAIYYSHENIFYKKWNGQHFQFGDFVLGQLTYASILNPLKILLFYESSNTLVFVDKYCNEIDRLDFNIINNFKNVHSVTPANDTRVWIFDTNTQQLEIFDTTSNTSIAQTQPLSELPADQDSNFNFCWLLTPKNISQFNIYGSLTHRFSNDGYSSLKKYNRGVLLQRQNTLFYWDSNTRKVTKLTLPEITIKQFYVTGEILYIYDAKTIYSFNLSPQKN